MANPNLRDDNTISKYNHEQILAKLEEIKNFEQLFPAFVIDELKIIDDLIEIVPKPEEFIPFKEPRESATPTVFRLRFTEDGTLENIDLKKPKPKKEIKPILTKIKNIKRVEKKESKVNDGGTKLSKLKGGLNKISKLKNIIPSRRITEKESKETEE